MAGIQIPSGEESVPPRGHGLSERGISPGMEIDTSLGAARLAESPQLFEQFPYGLLVANREGRVLQLNHRARQTLLPADPAPIAEGWSCCELICQRLGSILGTGCMSEWTLRAEGELPEVRIDLEQGRLQTAAWVTTSVLDADRLLVLFHLRPGRPGDRRRRTPASWGGKASSADCVDLQVRTLGKFTVEGVNGPIDGEWLAQRPGEVLKYLVCERRRAVANDQIGEALWPGAGPDEGRNRLRFHVHTLREKIEPERTHRSAARFVVSRRGGYLFDTGGVWIDADEFEREARAGLAAMAQGDEKAAARHLCRAIDLYRGEFMSEDPYAEWALEERERLRELAARALRAQVEIHLEARQLEAAASPAHRPRALRRRGAKALHRDQPDAGEAERGGAPL